MTSGTADALFTPTTTGVDSVTAQAPHGVQLPATALAGDTVLSPTPAAMSTVTIRSPSAVTISPVNNTVTSFTPTALTATAVAQPAPSAPKAVANAIAGVAHYTIPEPIRRWDGNSWTYQYKPRP